MTRLLQRPIDTSKTHKYFWRALLFFCLLPILINTLVLVPIYSTLEADVVYSGSALSVVIKYIQDIFDLCAFSVSYALLIFSLLLLSKKELKLTVIFYIVAFFAQIPLKLLMNAVVYGTLGNSMQITIDIVYLSVYFLLQILQLLVVYGFAKVDSDKYKLYVSSLDTEKAINLSDKRLILPFSKFVDWYNPLLRSAIKTGILILSLKLLTRVINDVTYGAPTSAGEVLLMVVYYLSDFIYGVVAYGVIVLTMSSLYEKLKKKDEL